MTHLIRRASVAPVMVAAMALVNVGATACSSSEKRADTATAAGAMTPAPATSMSPAAGDSMGTMRNMPTPPTTTSSQEMSGMRGMANMSGDADKDFLRMMSDHHKGLILLAHMTKERKDGGMSAAAAKKLDAKQDVELDKMMGMLEKSYKDAYAPKVMAEHQEMADALKAKRGKEYERTFYQDIVKHHQEAIKMIDDYLPKGKSAAVKQMAEKMKADQSKEMQEFEGKAAKIGG